MKTQNSYLTSNLKLLRERQKKSQEDIASALGVKRSKYNSYENGVALNPPIDVLRSFTKYFKISADSLLWVNLKRLSELQLRNLEAGNDEYIMGTQIRVLATTLDAKNRENIEIVPIKAKAGYSAGYSNPEFIQSLETFHFPVLSSNKKFRMFQIEGDSMLPIPDKSFVIAAFVQDWRDIKNGQACIVLTKEEGIIFKELTNNIKKDRSFKMHSMNPLFKDYVVKASEINEIWVFHNYISTQIPQIESNLETLSRTLSEIKSVLLKSKKLD